MKRSKFSLSHYRLHTMPLGRIIPIGLTEVLPGDTVQQATSALVRVTPLVAPVMHPVHVRIHHWFVPHRLVWENWEKFITGGPDGLDASVVPTANFAVTPGSLMDHYGVPPGAIGDREFSALPLRGYGLIFNEWYRDQDLVDQVAVSFTDGNDFVTNQSILPCAWEKDYFTTSRPWVTKGGGVSLPIGIAAPVVSTGDGIPSFTALGVTQHINVSGGGGDTALRADTGSASPDSYKWQDPKLVADLQQASAVGINELREAFALQRYQEARARYGSRYTEYLAYLGVRAADARLQRPEYLGGGKQTIQFSEVLQTGPNDPATGNVIGGLSGHGIGALRSNRYRRFFSEHGYIHSFMMVLPRTMYSDGMARHWGRRTKEDYWQRELQHIGQQEVYNWETYRLHSTPDGVFGYQDRYDEYRRHESGIAGDFRTTMNHWHYARQFASEPALNASFVQADPTNRVYAEQTADPLWVMVNHSIQARRMVSKTGSSMIK